MHSALLNSVTCMSCFLKHNAHKHNQARMGDQISTHIQSLIVTYINFTYPFLLKNMHTAMNFIFQGVKTWIGCKNWRYCVIDQSGIVRKWITLVWTWFLDIFGRDFCEQIYVKAGFLAPFGGLRIGQLRNVCMCISPLTQYYLQDVNHSYI